ncbi:MAG: hypothetical protein KatS3mg025_1412 [Bacteroidia bacterium]|nr:MAG: hypothetical protein KatS3mg025_1412 [Bacteroidia bacterium]
MNGEPLISVIVSAGPARERAIHLEGGLFGPDLLERLEAGALPGQRWEDFKPAAAKGAAPRSLIEEIAEVYRDARDLWRVFQRRLERLPDDDPATSLTREGWIIPFLGLLGYELRYNPRAYQVGEVSYALSHRAGENEDAPPVHIVGARQALGRVDPRARPPPLPACPLAGVPQPVGPPLGPRHKRPHAAPPTQVQPAAPPSLRGV